jgi:hypothetical protein
VASLHVDWAVPTTEAPVEVKFTNNFFDYDLGSHKEDPSRRMMRFKATFQQLDGNQQKVGFTIRCELIGMFRFTEATPKGKEESVLRINGVSQLYGAMRGIVTVATGSFGVGHFLLPSLMPQEIVAEVEKIKAAAFAQDQLPAKPLAPSAP